MKKIIIEFDENNGDATLVEGSFAELFAVLLTGGKDFTKLILDGYVTILGNTEHFELMMSDLFKSLAIGKNDPIALEELEKSKKDLDEMENLLGKDLAPLAKVSGDA